VLIMPTLGWRWLLATSAAAAPLVLWVRLRVPESARYLLNQGRRGQAHELLARVATANRRQPRPLAVELTLAPGQGRAGPAALLRGGPRRETLMLWAGWLIIAFGYYGIFAWLPQIFAQRYGFLRTYQCVFFLVLAQLPGNRRPGWWSGAAAGQCWPPTWPRAARRPCCGPWRRTPGWCWPPPVR
jgi:putative MFS transporter